MWCLSIINQNGLTKIPKSNCNTLNSTALRGAFFYAKLAIQQGCTMKYIICMLIALVSLEAFAQRQGPPSSAGIVYREASPIYIYDSDTTWPVLPAFTYSGENFYLLGISFGYRVRKAPPMMSVEISPNLQALDPDDDSRLSGLDERKWTVHGGFSISMPTPFGMTSLKFQQDLLNRHQGQVITLGWHKRFQASEKWSFGIGARATAYLPKYTRYYYGVSQEEAQNSSFNAYQPDTGYEYGPNAVINYFLAPGSVSLMFMYSYSWLSSQIKNSPLVPRDTQYSMMAGVMYYF